MLDDKQAVTGIVHSGEDRFTLIQDPARYSEVDSDTHPNVVDLIGKIADTVWAAQTSQQTLIKPAP